MKHVRYGFQVRTTTGQVISSAEMSVDAPDEISDQSVETQLVEHIHSDMNAQIPNGGMWDIGPAESTHTGVGGPVSTIVNLRHVESVAVWVTIEGPETAPRHAATPVSTWEPGADDFRDLGLPVPSGDQVA